ncbi:MAG: hypothetical protein H7Z76_04755 [Methylotenera sp.]|nr:hypothetical protein [Flavobacterium sp.]
MEQSSIYEFYNTDKSEFDIIGYMNADDRYVKLHTLRNDPDSHILFYLLIIHFHHKPGTMNGRKMPKKTVIRPRKSVGGHIFYEMSNCEKSGRNHTGTKFYRDHTNRDGHIFCCRFSIDRAHFLELVDRIRSDKIWAERPDAFGREPVLLEL